MRFFRVFPLFLGPFFCGAFFGRSKAGEWTGPDFYFDMVDDATPLQKGDFIVTVIFHLKDRPKLVELKDEEMTPGQKRLDLPELCSSFLIAVAEEDEIDLLTFEDEQQQQQQQQVQHKDGGGGGGGGASQTKEGEEVVAVVQDADVAGKDDATNAETTAKPIVPPPQFKRRTRPVIFELFGDGSDIGPDPLTGVQRGIKWEFISPEVEAMRHLRIISTASFRHIYSDPRVQKVFNRDECLERCRLLTGHTPFPLVLVETNVDLLANGLMVGWLPETCPDDFALVMEDRGLTKGFITKEQFQLKATYDRRLKMSKKRLKGVLETAAALKPLHHLSHLSSAVRIGHLGIIIESGIIVGGAAFDAVYDPNNLVKNAKRRSKLGIASTIGAAVGGGLGILIPIPGLFVLMSMGGSVAGRWIAGKFVTEDGTEHEDVIPVGRLRDDEDNDLLEVMQELDEEDPQWMVTWNNLQNRVGLGDQPRKQQPQHSQSAPASLWDRITGRGGDGVVPVKDGDLLSFDAPKEEHDTEGETEDEEGEDEEEGGGESPPEPEKVAVAVANGEKDEEDEEISKRPIVATIPDRQLMRGSPDVSVASAAAAKKVATASAAAASPQPSSSYSSWWPLGGGGTSVPPAAQAAVVAAPPPAAEVPKMSASMPVISNTGPVTTPPAASSSSSSSSSTWWPWGGGGAPKPAPPTLSSSIAPPVVVTARDLRPPPPKSSNSELLAFSSEIAASPPPMSNDKRPAPPSHTSELLAFPAADQLGVVEPSAPLLAFDEAPASVSLLSFDGTGNDDAKPAQLLVFEEVPSPQQQPPQQGGNLLFF